VECNVDKERFVSRVSTLESTTNRTIDVLINREKEKVLDLMAFTCRHCYMVASDSGYTSVFYSHVLFAVATCQMTLWNVNLYFKGGDITDASNYV